MILTSSPFKVVAYPAASRAGLATLTSSLRPRHYIIPSLAADLLGCISAYKEKKANTQTNKEETNPTIVLQIWCTGKLHLYSTVIQRKQNPCRGHLY